MDIFFALTVPEVEIGVASFIGRLVLMWIGKRLPVKHKSPRQPSQIKSPARAQRVLQHPHLAISETHQVFQLPDVSRATTARVAVLKGSLA